jgi:hypothetical protein
MIYEITIKKMDGDKTEGQVSFYVANEISHIFDKEWYTAVHINAKSGETWSAKDVFDKGLNNSK